MANKTKTKKQHDEVTELSFIKQYIEFSSMKKNYRRCEALASNSSMKPN